MHVARVWLLGAVFILVGGQTVAAHGEDEAVDFRRDVYPILKAHCFACHAGRDAESGYRLDLRAEILGATNGEPLVEVGNSEKSRLIELVARVDPDEVMPPVGEGEPLSEKQINILRAWIEGGLAWDDTLLPSAAGDGSGHWAFQPVKRPPLPETGMYDGAWVRTPVDAFVSARHGEQGLAPSPPADRRTLIVRATLDLLGIPPTPEEVDAFAADPSPNAYPRLIDRLLASPRYGERWGRHWLDVARYADTKGYAFGRERRFPFAYTYRDWVIKALNADLPYDEFILRQLAADRLGDADPANHAALGFLTVGRKYNNDHDDIDDQIDVVTRGLLGLTVACARCHDHKYDAIPTEDYYSLYGVFASSTPPDEYPLIGDAEDTPGYAAYKAELDKRQQAFDDFAARKHAELIESSRRNVTDYLVRVVTKKPESLLAKLPFISLNADDLKPELIERWRRYLLQPPKRDHPVWGPLVELQRLPEKDFADQAAQQISASQGEPTARLNPLVIDALAGTLPANKEQLAKAYGQLLAGAYDAWKKEGGNDEARARLAPPRRQLLDELLGSGTPTDIPRENLRPYLIRADRNKLRELKKAVDTHMARSEGAPPRAMSLVDRERPFNPRVFIRGNHLRRGEQVPRRFLRVVAGEKREPFTGGSGRLELAEAIIDTENPLTARVIVNRVWQHLFGRPLVATPSDFGMRSDGPTHPQLLDYLAWRLKSPLPGKERSGEVASKSRTPSPPLAKGDNGFGWSLKALHREIMLSATYRQASGDRPECRERDPENGLLWKMNRQRLEFEPLRDALLAVGGNLDTQMYGRPVDIFASPSSSRRSVYAFIDRQDLPNVLRAFDFANPDQSSAGRPRTTVPQQALFMMNSPFAIAQAKALIARPAIASPRDDSARIAALYRLLFARPPSEAELAAGRQFLAATVRDKLPDDRLTPWQQYAQLLLSTNEFMFVD